MLEKILDKFNIEGKLVKYKKNSEGHINSTFIATFDTGRKYTCQKINQHVFHHPDQVMMNIVKVTNHIQNKVKNLPQAEKRCLKVVNAKDGKPFLLFNGDYYRCYDYIDDVKTFSKLDGTPQAFLLGQTISDFQLKLSDFDGSQLFETVTDFHNMENRYKILDKAIEKNVKNRVSEVNDELEFLFKNRERGKLLWEEMKAKIIPIRVTHNDTKINNILFSSDGTEALCVIDLDTIMPGTLLFDVGDMIRTATATADEDTTDVSSMHCNPKLFEALISGYLSNAKSFISKREKELLFESGRNITQIMAVRMLTDYIMGDVYYHINRPSQNLDRARAQISLVKDLDKNYSLLNSLIK